MPGLLSDTLRLLRDSVFWNTRKTWHIARGRRGRCPCQVASDSGRAGRTGCEAATPYEVPGRFRHVCPLLVARSEGGWVCSVDASEVRPFWGRALAHLGAAAAILAVIACLGVFALMRGIGYDVALRQVAWPPAWRELRAVQADFYRDRAKASIAAGRLPEAMLYLSNAYELAPRDYPTGALLARLHQTTQPVLSDQTYSRLFNDHPDRREETAQVWFRALLARGDFPAVQRLSGERILHTPANPAWTQAFLFSTRQIGEAAGIEALLATPGLPAAAAPLLRAELALYSQTAAERVASAERAVREAPDGFAAYHWLRRLLEDGRADLAFAAASRPGGPLDDRERLRVQLDALAALGREPERERVVRRLLERPTHPALSEVLAAHLITHPSPALLAAWLDKLDRDPLPLTEDAYPRWLAVFAAAGAHRDDAAMQRVAARLNSIAGRTFKTLDPVRAQFLRIPSGARLQNLLPVLQPMPLDITYTLYARFEPPPPFAP